MSGIGRFRARLRRSARRSHRPDEGRPGRQAPAPSGRDLSDPSPGRQLRSLLNVRTVAGQVFVFILGLVLLLVVAGAVALVVQGRRDTMDEARAHTLSVAETFAYAPGTAAALDSKDPTAILQPRAEEVRKRTHVEYVVVMSPQGIRYTHPDPALIGKHVIGPYKEALTGPGFTRTVTASRGRAVISVVPVPRPDGSVAGLVSVGITVESVNSVADRSIPFSAGAAAVALALTAGGAAFLSRRLRRQTHGLGAAEMTRMYEHHDAVLHAVREGVLIVEADRRLTLANDEARRLLDLPPDAEGRPVAGLGLDPGTAELLVSGRTVTDEVLRSGNRLLAVNLRPTDTRGGPPGTVVTLRDTTELRAVTGQAEYATERLLLLYEAGARIGTTLDVTRTAQELTEVAIPGFADAATVDLADPVLHGDEPVTPDGGTLEMRRTAVASVRPDHPLYPVGHPVGFVPTRTRAMRVHSDDADLQGDFGRLGWRNWDPDVAERLREQGFHSLVSVPMHARGTVLGMANFWRSGDSEPFDDDDLSFAEELVARGAVGVDNARRYTREHSLAVTLQRSLLPRGLPEQNALDVAYRYLPAYEGVGGDWFDVIPLSGARVALVVGDVVGHGLHAAATMGRLRTSVHNFSSLDPAPDELLGHLDELVSRIDRDEADDHGAEIAGATCLYAIYDAVSGNCAVARAGHPGPVLVRPDGTVEFPEVPTGLPLGIGGMPFEAAEFHVPEGSRLVLYTDGLVERRGRDIDTGLALLRDSLAGRDRTPEETCDDVLDALLHDRPNDDVALLVARTRTLDPDQVAQWAVATDPAAVAGVRKNVAQWLTDRGLEEEAFATELILSELVTNAVRYGTAPIEVRLLYDRNLICEVSDSSSTSPHLRYAATTDEGGRGLFLVAQFAERWGTRYTETGKVIWSEQAVGESGSDEPLLDGF
ncbi:SpoIIE family protein phosphatase [Streptomyces sp. NBC_00264]|uniref:SpoIIE family protein phosphatase n=1 Tax=unclassified Streptomyces TaxID=2593676 RepID=UPI002257BE62|nr:MULTISPECIES: SpoIIE family protein phosphatase [unclassified Streptomyces]MCX5163225.1 SpoIIE family protein phosphatase [Streptomyces sp. NBC_00305]MCX5221749.1 SpoIIE family protein phosphatase [Streptomyces sp. NBC_00264]